MRMPEPGVQRQVKPEEEEEGPLQERVKGTLVMKFPLTLNHISM